jgi:hypothetical protein
VDYGSVKYIFLIFVLSDELQMFFYQKMYHTYLSLYWYKPTVLLNDKNIENLPLAKIGR